MKNKFNREASKQGVLSVVYLITAIALFIMFSIKLNSLEPILNNIVNFFLEIGDSGETELATAIGEILPVLVGVVEISAQVIPALVLCLSVQSYYFRKKIISITSEQA